MNQNERKKHIFSRSKEELFFINHLDKEAILTLILMLLTFYFLRISYAIRASVIALLVVVPFIFLFTSHHGQFAYKIIIDRETDEMHFYMFRNKGVIVSAIRNIEKIQDGSYLTFFLNDRRKVKWNKNSEELLQIMKETNRITY